jgi:hypothetical protein
MYNIVRRCVCPNLRTIPLSKALKESHCCSLLWEVCVSACIILELMQDTNDVQLFAADICH